MLLFHLASHAQGGTWTWMGGSAHPNATAVYGTQGISGLHNTPAGAYEASNWIDLDGNFWVFGGNTDSGTYSDMWKYDTQINMWTWEKGTGIPQAQPIYGVKGIPSAINNPGGRCYGTLTWTDTAGNLWLYGGDGFDSSGNFGVLGDLWRYHINTNEWTWMNGPNLSAAVIVDPLNYGAPGVPSDTITPGWRDESNTNWIDDSNQLWLYGGDCADYGCNDMWLYKIDLNEWVYMGGPQFAFQVQNYGIKGIESPSNIPPSRSAYAHWKDLDGNFYMYGGIDFYTFDVFDDVWRYNIVTHNWTWIAGDDYVGALGDYSEYCISDNYSHPMGRFENRSAVSLGSLNNFISFGGSYCPDSSYTPKTLSDLWLFDYKTLQWQLLDGSNITGQGGDFGNFQVPSNSNYPEANAGQCQWIDKIGDLWVWGGVNFANSLWRFVPDCSCMKDPLILPKPLQYEISDTTICQGDTIYITFLNALTMKVVPYSSNVVIVSPNHYVIIPDTSQTYTISGQTVMCGAIDSVNVNIRVLIPQFSIAANKNDACGYDSVELSAPVGFPIYQWNTGQTTSSIYTNTSGTYNVTVSNNNCAAISDSFTVKILPVIQATVSISGDTLIASRGGLINQWYLNNNPVTGATSQTYLANSSGTYTVQITDSDGCVASSSGQLTIYPLTDNHINIFPNPTTTNWKIVVGPEWLGSELNLYDDIGRLIYKNTVANLQTIIDVTPIASAVYELRLTQSGYSVTKKLVKLQE